MLKFTGPNHNPHLQFVIDSSIVLRSFSQENIGFPCTLELRTKLELLYFLVPPP